MTRFQQHGWRGYAYIAAATLCWGVSATLGRAAFTGRLLSSGALEPIGPLILTQSRATLSLLVVAPILLLRRGPKGLTLSRWDFVRAMLAGTAGLAASNYFYYLAIQKTNVATAIILQYTAPVWVLLYMVLRGLQRATIQRVASVGLAVIGSVLAIGVVGEGQLAINRAGVGAAMLAALAFAYYNIAVPKLLIRHDRWKVLLYVLLASTLCWLIVNPPWRVFETHYSREQIGFMVAFAVISALLPFSLYIAGLQHLDSTRAIVTSCLEPVFSILIAAVALGELVYPVQVVGIVVVLLATVLVQIRGRREPATVIEPIE